MMQQQQHLQQPTAAPPTANNDWQKQQLNSHQYQHNATANNSWQQGEQQQQQHQQPPTAAIATFRSYYARKSQEAALPLQQPIAQQQQFYQPTQQQQQQHGAASFFQQTIATKTATQQPLQNDAQSFFDNNANSSASIINDGWDSWDWNDNSNEQQSHQTSNSIIADSFNTQANDNWQNWGGIATEAVGVGDDGDVAITNVVTPVVNAASTTTNIVPTIQVPSVNDEQQQQLHLNNSYKVPQQQKVVAAVAAGSAENNCISKATTKPNVAAVKSPTILPLTESTNDDYNLTPVVAAASSIPLAPTTANNIPSSSVYVSQAKPVSRPSRQYASPPAGTTPSDVLPPVDALTPPQAFQNEPHSKGVGAGFVPPPLTTILPQLSNSSSGVVAAPCSAAMGNPFKRSGAPQHHRVGLLTTTAGLLPLPPPPLTPGSSTCNLPPSPPDDFANPIESDNGELYHENQEVITPSPNITTQPITMPPPNDDRDQYLQTSHLSENLDEELNIEGDNLPPPGLSRLVLGQPETEEHLSNIAVAAANMHMEERHADGEDTSTELTAMTTMLQQNRNANDRNLYLVPGENNDANNRRVVTGVENVHTTMITSEQREIELDGENLDDPQKPPSSAAGIASAALSPPTSSSAASLSIAGIVTNRNEPPFEGASSTTEMPAAVLSATHIEMTVSTLSSKSKDLSNISTGNDESDPIQEEQHHHNNHHNRYTTNKTHKPAEIIDKRSLVDKQRRDKKRSVDRYDTEESAEYSSDREHERDRRRNYREGSVRSNERGGEKRDYKEKRRHDRHGDSGGGSGGDIVSERVKARDKYYYRDENGKSERRSNRHNRYDGDSKYETEESTRHEISRKDHSRRSTRGVPMSSDDRGGGGRSDRDYDDYHRRYRGSKREQCDFERERRIYDDDIERRDRRRDRRDRDRDDYNTLERRNRGDKHHGRSERGGAADSRDYDDYRKQSSRTARDSDVEKDARSGGRNGAAVAAAAGAVVGGTDLRYDARHAAMYGYPTAATYGYDPYAYYYEQMARTNPQAYAEWYKKYYGTTAAVSAVSAHNTTCVGGITGIGDHFTNSSVAATDGRESVHSGRSSVNNEKERYTQAYIKQANENYHQRYYRQQQQQQQLKHHHHHSDRYYLQQQQQQQIIAMSFNSTMINDDGTAASIGSNSAALYYGSGVSASASIRGSTNNLSLIPPILADYSIGGVSNIKCSGGGVGGVGLYYGLQEHDIGVGAFHARTDYAESRSGNLSRRNFDHATDRDPDFETQRLTPCKFINEHACVSITAGLLVTVKPKYTSHGTGSYIVRMQRLRINDATLQLFQAFPGPLVRGLTHKKTVIEFCEEQIRMGPPAISIYTKQNASMNRNSHGYKYRPSYTLMWNLLVLLLRQNGMVVGTDIAELLLKNQQQYPYKLQFNKSMLEFNSQIPSDNEENDNDKDKKKEVRVEEEGEEHLDKTKKQMNSKTASETGEENDNAKKSSKTKLESSSASSSTSSTTDKAKSLSETEITEKFRNYLLYGNVNEALDWATENNLWGHALFLASKVDRRSHANVMMKFANKLALNDPLQTLYQLMSGRTPSSVTSVQDEKWGDWRPHLSMILSNTSQKPELDRKAITTLGDSLFNRGDLYAAHFCYLMAQVNFGRYSMDAMQETTLQQNLPKLVLLGSSHYKSFNEFANNEAIIMTEIYEYACSLNDDKFSVVEFQPYKYLLATRLLDYGYHLRSLMYMEQISLQIQRDPSKYEASFINKIYEFADRLKYYDPVLEKTMDDQLQQQQEFNTDNNLNGDSIGAGGAGSGHVEEQKWLKDLRGIALQYKLEYNVNSPSMDTIQDSHNYHQATQNQIDQQFAEISKQFSELNMQYNSVMETQQAYNTATDQQQQHKQQSQQEQLQQQPAVAIDNHNEHYQQYYQQQAVNEYNQQQQGDVQSINDAIAGPYANYMQPGLPQQHQQNDYNGPTQQKQQQQSSALDADAGTAVGAANAAADPSYDYWAQQQYQQQQQQQCADEYLVNNFKGQVYLKRTTTTPSATTTATGAMTATAASTSVATAAAAAEEAAVTSTQRTTATNSSTILLPTSKNDNRSATIRNLIKSPSRIKSNPALARQLKTTLEKSKTQQQQPYKTNDLNRTAATIATKLTTARQINCNNNNLMTTTKMVGTSTRTEPISAFLTNDNATRPNISMPKSKTYDDNDDINEKTWRQQQQQQQQQRNKNDTKASSVGKSLQQSSQNSGWFGGIWNKLSLKPKNQMILPDDKNPTIVWDSEKKSWVNTDGDEADGGDSLKPPPKMSDILTQPLMHAHPQQQQQHHQLQQQHHLQQQQPSPLLDVHAYGAGGGVGNAGAMAAVPTIHTAAMPLTKVPAANEAAYSSSSVAGGLVPDANANAGPAKQLNLQSNMFKMKRNRTLKNSYVDVFNPSGAPISKAAVNVLAPMIPPAVPQGGYFIPGAVPTNENAAAVNTADVAYQQHQQQLPQQDVPQFYNPIQFGNGDDVGY